MKTSLPFAYYIALFFLTFSNFAGAQTLNPATPALGFQVFVQNNMTARNGNVSGPVAVGGDMDLAGNVSIAMNNSGQYPLGAGNANNYGLVINGSINFTSGGTSYVNRGYIRLGNITGSKIFDKDQNNSATNLRISKTSFNSNPQLQLQRMQSAGALTQPNEINFTDAFLRMNQYSASINNLVSGDAVALVTIPATSNPHIRLTPNKLNVINLTATQLNSLTSQGSIIFDHKPSATQPVVINVKINNDLTWNTPNLAGIGDADGAFLIWNFFTTSTVTMSANNSLFGTLMAPSAHVVKTGNGNFNGQIIAKSFELKQGMINYHPLNINLKNIIPESISLPLQNIDLSARLQSANIQLSWTSYGESDIDTYTVEGSADGTSFSTIKTLNSFGAGTNNYKAIIGTQEFNKGSAYLRIKAVEKSGKLYYSKVVLVKTGNDIRVQTWPNPIVDKIYLSFSSDANSSLNIQVLDLRSVSVRQEFHNVTKGFNQLSVDGLAGLPSGLYFLKIYDVASGETTIKKISK